MPHRLALDWPAWWATVTPEFLFLVALPLLVAGVALLGDWVRGRRRPPR